jgi:hypothetical protein
MPLLTPAPCRAMVIAAIECHPGLPFFTSAVEQGAAMLTLTRHDMFRGNSTESFELQK